MDQAFELADHLPLSFKTQAEQEYIAFLWDAFETNYENGKYQFSFFAYHMLMMSFINFNLWQIKTACPEDFRKGLIGFGVKEEKILLDAKTPFAFGTVRESAVLRFLKLIACDNGQIGNFGALVKIRNETAHANGNIFFSTQAALDEKINDVLRAVGNIQTRCKPLIEHCYREFLLQSHNPEEREYLDESDQVREVLIHDHYLSRKDLEYCLAFDISELRKRAGFSQIETLHNSLCEDYGTE